MYVVQQRATVKYGKFREYHTLMVRLNEIAAEKGWLEGQLLVPLAGVDNEYIIEGTGRSEIFQSAPTIA